MSKLALFNLFQTKPRSPAPVATFNVANSAPSARELLRPENNAALLQVQRWELNEGGGENTAFAALEAAFQRSPTIDGMGLLMSSFVSAKSRFEININGGIRQQVTQGIQAFYSTRRQGVTTSQYRQQRPPADIFSAARNQVHVDLQDVMTRMINGGAIVVDGNVCKVFRVAEVQSDSLQTQGRHSTLADLRSIYGAAQRMGLQIPSGLLTLGF